MPKQVGKIGTVRRELEGKACPFCGGKSISSFCDARVPSAPKHSSLAAASAYGRKTWTKILDAFSGCRDHRSVLATYDHTRRLHDHSSETNA